MEKLFFGIAFSATTLSMILFFAYALTRRESLARTAKGALITAVGSHAIALLIRTYQGYLMPVHTFYVPWSNWFESFSFLGFVISLEFLVIQSKRDIPILGTFITPLVFGALVAAVRSPVGMQIPELTPVLQSYWLAVHVPMMFVAYAAFANAFGVGVAFVIQERQLKSHKPSHLIFRMPALDDLDRMIYRIIWWAFPVLTLGLLVGSRWAYEAWGRYWGWDPKEISSVISLLAYLSYLIMRSVFGWRGRKAAYLSMVGFLIVLGSYVGVNYFSPLHGFLSNVGR